MFCFNKFFFEAILFCFLSVSSYGNIENTKGRGILKMNRSIKQFYERTINNLLILLIRQ